MFSQQCCYRPTGISCRKFSPSRDHTDRPSASQTASFRSAYCSRASVTIVRELQCQSLIHLAEIAAIHFCSSCLNNPSAFIKPCQSLSRTNSLIEMQHHPQNRHKLHLMLLLLLLQKLQQHVLQIRIIDCIVLPLPTTADRPVTRS